MKKKYHIIYRQLRTKDEYRNYYKSEDVAKDYAGRDFSGLSPQITRAETETILKLVQKNSIKKDSLLDLATGSARILSQIEDKFTSSTGVDSSRIMLKFAKKRTLKSKFITADIEKLPFKNSSFNVVTCFRILINIPQPNRINVLKEASRVLKKDGLFIINIHQNKLSPRGLIEIAMAKRSASRSMSYFGVKSDLKKAGFEIISSQGINISTISKLTPFLSHLNIIKINEILNSVPMIKIFSDTLIFAAKKLKSKS